MAYRNRLEQRGAQRRGEGQREKAREQNRHRQRQRELLVDHPHRTRHEGQRQEHRRQNQGDTDDRPGHLPHRLDGRRHRRQAFLGHDPLDVLHHHDGVVHQDADGQHHAEHGHHVHREAQQVHEGQGTKQTHRHDDGRDQGVAHVLQEQEHHQEHQHHGLDEGHDDLVDGHVDEARGVVRHGELDVVREVGRQLGQTLLDRLGGLDRVGTGRQLHGGGNGGLAVLARAEVVVLAADLDACHVAQGQARAVLVGTQHDGGEFLRVVQGALDRQGRRQLLLAGTRRAAEGTGRHLHVLRADGVVHVINGQAVANQLLRIDPHAHGRLGGEELQFADTGYPADFVVDTARRVVGQRRDIGVLVAIGVAQRIDQQEAGGGLLGLDAEGQHGLRHARLGLLQTVLHVDLGQFGVGPRLEGDGDLGYAVGVAGGLEVQQVLGAVEFFLDDAGHRVGQHLRRGAGIGGGHGNLRRRHVGVLCHRQERNDQQAT